MNTSKILLPILVAAISGVSAFGIHQAYADSTGGTSLAQMIAQKFKLNQSQVQSVITDYRQHNLSNRLDNDVRLGKITSAQKQQILDEVVKLQNEYPRNKFHTMTPTEREASFVKEQSEIVAWSKSTGINKSYLMPHFFWMGHGRHKSNMTITPTP